MATIAAGQPGKTSPLRRSQRVCLSVVVEVALPRAGSETKRERTTTLMVSAHGALIRLQMEVIVGDPLQLRNVATDKQIECRVATVSAASEEEPKVGVEFVEAQRNFWHIAFPPVDWSPHGEESKLHGPQVVAKISNDSAARKPK